ncbi:MAG: ABC transporter ATP-binding protein [Arenicellales bacterium]|jgi:ABC-type branched-subunit amino acid transport system ATPase component|nr:ABC transporter ATP-binding protein [Arenicellales bacterium]MDP7063522.1 ABC transporter ATP-binding protein [Arenicellales bacterium]MED5390915.1 ABC transporter ATP-binding protein [Pseudomonadota bacterium]|tara:strand:- start:205 stop:960 length:756 start_codon:yes stop_codon:yes gene_type:complete
MSDFALEVIGLHKNFGALEVAHNIDFTLKRGARHALIGPNGAGKTTFINLITGVLAPSSGQIILNGQDITGLGEAERSRCGLARTFQINQLFRGLTVLENVVLAIAERQGIASSMFRPLSSYSEVTDEAMDLLGNFELDEDALRRIDELPYGRQRLVEIVIALGQRPSVLLLDEPAAGIPSSESQHILDAASALSSDITVLIIEHDMEIVFSVADYITVLVSGAVLTEGEPEVIAADERVRAVYLGEVDRG